MSCQSKDFCKEWPSEVDRSTRWPNCNTHRETLLGGAEAGGRRPAKLRRCCRPQSRRKSACGLPCSLLTGAMAVLDFHCGDLTGEALLVAAGNSRFNQCEAHFAIGLRHLAVGDKRLAKNSLRAAIDTGVFTYIDYLWASNFLARMEADPNWPEHAH